MKHLKCFTLSFCYIEILTKKNCLAINCLYRFNSNRFTTSPIPLSSKEIKKILIQGLILIKEQLDVELKQQIVEYIGSQSFIKDPISKNNKFHLKF